MILGHISPAIIGTFMKVPEEVRAASMKSSVSVWSEDVPYSTAEGWIACRGVTPHTDVYFDDRFFITLSVISNHYVCDWKHYPKGEQYIPPGTLFVIDPRVPHWLSQDYTTDEVLGWVGIQWEVYRSSAARDVRAIMKEVDATWVDKRDISRTYRKWLPKEKAA